MDFGSWGDRMSAEQKKAMKERMKPFLELHNTLPYALENIGRTNIKSAILSKCLSKAIEKLK